MQLCVQDHRGNHREHRNDQSGTHLLQGSAWATLTRRRALILINVMLFAITMPARVTKTAPLKWSVNKDQFMRSAITKTGTIFIVNNQRFSAKNPKNPSA